MRNKKMSLAGLCGAVLISAGASHLAGPGVVYAGDRGMPALVNSSVRRCAKVKKRKVKRVKAPKDMNDGDWLALSAAKLRREGRGVRRRKNWLESLKCNNCLGLDGFIRLVG